MIKWICLSSPYVKIKFDGSVSNSVAARGFIIRSWSSKPIIAGAMNLGSSAINVAEARALCEALIWAKRRNLMHMCMEGDSKLIIDAICGVCEVPWNLRTIIEDIRWCAFFFFLFSRISNGGMSSGKQTLLQMLWRPLD